MPSRSLRGLSLVEVLVSSVLLAMLTLVMATLLNTQLRIGRKSFAKMASDRSHILLLESLRQDMTSTTSAGLTLRADGRALAVQPVRDVTPQGLLEYRLDRLVAYRYDLPNKRLNRGVWYNPTPFPLVTPAQRLTPGQWIQLENGAPPVRVGHWDNLLDFKVRADSVTPGLVSSRTWVDCRWKHLERTWEASYCLVTRQLP